jgi:hypothetical protein
MLERERARGFTLVLIDCVSDTPRALILGVNKVKQRYSGAVT